MEYAIRLAKIESIKARERQSTSTGGSNPQLRQISDEADPEQIFAQGRQPQDKNGNNQHKEDFANCEVLPKTQETLLKEFVISVDTLNKSTEIGSSSAIGT